jgi:hypothetical protein
MVDDVFDGKRDIRDVLRELRPVVPAPAASRPSAEPSEAETTDAMEQAIEACLCDLWLIAHARMLPANVQTRIESAVARIRKLRAALSARPAAGSETRG